MFVISPDGEPELLPVAEKIVAMAPEVPGWEILAARPARPISEFSIESDGRTIQVDPKRWRYVLYKFSDGVFDIVLAQDGLEGVSEAERYAAAFIFLDGALGEARRMHLIRDVEVAAMLSPEQVSKASAAEHLAAHMTSLILTQ